MEPGVRGVSVQLVEVVGELRLVYAKASAADRLSLLSLPVIDRLAAEHGGRGSLPVALGAAIAELRDDTMRTAAMAMFPLPYDDGVWDTAKTRGGRAAGAFGVSYEAFRKSGDGRPRSRLELVLEDVAGALVAHYGGVLVDGADVAPAPRTFRRGVVVGVAVVTLVVLLGAGAIVVELSAGESAPAPLTVASTVQTHCSGTVGELGAALPGDPPVRDAAARLRRTYRRAGGARLGCPAGPAYRWGSLAVQDLLAHGTSNGSLVVSPNGVDLWMNQAAFTSYHQIGGRSGDVAQLVGGLPVKMVKAADGQAEIRLSTGTILVAEAPDAPYFWILGTYVPWWRAHPEFGLPAGNPLPNFHQDFQHGYAMIRPGDIDPEFTAVTDPAARLPAHPEGHVLRQPDGTAWHVERVKGRLVRHWVPDGGTWVCLDGDHTVIRLDVDGPVASALPYAGHAHCPRK